MQIPLQSNGLPFTIVLYFNVKEKCAIVIKIVDARLIKTIYLNSRYEAQPGQKQISINVPVSGIAMTLDISVEDHNDTNGFIQLTDIKTKIVPVRKIYLTDPDKKYFEYIKWFAQNSGSLQPGIYQNKDKSATIEYFDEIIDAEDGKLTTPARVDHETGNVQVAKKYFDGFSVPMRFFIMAHERVHYSYETQNETECDNNAVNVSMAMGFPKLETLYAATKIFPDNPAGRARSLNIKYKLDEYN